MNPPQGPYTNLSPPGYGPPHPGVPVGASHERNRSATIALVLGIAGLLSIGITGPFAVFFGLRGRKEVAAQPGRYTNAWHATAGLALGILGCLALITYVSKPSQPSPASNSPSPGAATSPARPRTAAADERSSAPHEKAIDPASCQKGRIIVDTKTGAALECTGGLPSKAPPWLTALGKLTQDPRGARPKSVDKSDPNEVDYAYRLPPFAEVTFTVFGNAPSRWTLALKSKSVGAGDLSVTGGPTRLCTKGIGTWYALEVGDGPLANSFAAVGEPDVDGMIDILVMSADLAAVEKSRDEAKGLPPTPSIKASFCR